MFKKYLTISILYLILSPMIATAEIWNESESDGACTGQWLKISGKRPGPLRFSADQQCGATIYHCDLTIYVVNNTEASGQAVFVERRNCLQNGPDCNYSGTVNLDNTVTGEYYCDLTDEDNNEEDINNNWKARILGAD